MMPQHMPDRTFEDPGADGCVVPPRLNDTPTAHPEQLVRRDGCGTPHRVSQGTWIIGRDSPARYILSHQIEGRSSLRRANHWQPARHCLWDDQTPSIVPTWHDQEVGLSIELRQFFPGKKTMSDYPSGGGSRQSTIQKLGSVTVTRDQETSAW